MTTSSPVQSITERALSATRHPSVTVSSAPHEAVASSDAPASAVGSELMVMRGTSKATSQRVWAVQSASQSKAAGYPVFHILMWDAARASWVCPCPARKPCVHMRLASAASQEEQKRIDAVFEALTVPQASQQKEQDAHEKQLAFERKCSTKGCFRDWKHECDICSEYYPGLGFWTDGAKYCDRCYQEKCTHQPKSEPIIVRNDTGPRLYRETPNLSERVREVM